MGNRSTLLFFPTSALGQYQPVSITPGERLETANSGHSLQKEISTQGWNFSFVIDPEFLLLDRLTRLGAVATCRLRLEQSSIRLRD